MSGENLYTEVKDEAADMDGGGGIGDRHGRDQGEQVGG